MEKVDAIKNKNEIETIKRLLKKDYGQIYYDIFSVGLNVALRISDLLNIKFSDIDFDNQKLIIKEKKTKKTRIIKLNDEVLRIIRKRQTEFSNDIYIFTSHARRSSGNKPITRQSVSRIFKDVGDRLSLNISTHSLRKTRGYHLYKNDVPIEVICKMFNHSSPKITLAYIGITQGDIDDTYDLIL